MQAKEAERPIQRRAGGKRSRAGCAVCRQRRVKCDEAKPICVRCVKLGLDCSYSRTTAPLSTVAHSNTSPTSNILLPKLPGHNQHTFLSAVRPSVTLPDETEVENRYVRYFQEETTSGFQSAWDWSLWNRLVLQGSHHEPFIRQAVVAIGALHKSLHIWSATGRDPGKLTNPSQDMARLHREFAYVSYGKALKKMQAVIDADPGPRHALIACLLIVCFESHTGNRYKALTHAKYGLRILDEWTELHGLSTKKKTKPFSPSPINVEDDIVEAFHNLDIQIATVSDDRTVDAHKRLMSEDLSVLSLMPDQFKTLIESKKYWTVVQRASCHFMGSTWQRTEPEKLTREFAKQVPGSILVTVGDTIHTTSFTVEETVRSGQQQISTEIERWMGAFRPLLSEVRRTTGKFTLRDYVIATMLQIQALVTKISIAGVAFTQEILYDQFLPEFTDIVRYAEDISRIKHSKTSSFDYWSGIFLVDLGLVAPLFIVMLRCRDPSLRRRTIALLESWHVECWWDPLLVISIGRFIMDVEEAEMVNGIVPETSRAILTAKSHLPSERALQVQCVQRIGGPGRGLKWTEKIVRW